LNQYAALLWRYLRPQWPIAGLLAICLLASVFVQLTVPQLIREFIDRAMIGASLETSRSIAVQFLGFALLNQAFSGGATYLSALVGWTATNEMRADLFFRALRLDMAFHKDRTPGEMIERVDGDVTSISSFFSQFIVRVATAVLMMLGVLTLLWREDWRVGLAMTTFTAVAVLILHWRREVAVEPTRLERETSAQLFGFIEERLNGLDDIRANGAGPYAMYRFLELQRTWFRNGMRAWWLRATIWISMGTLFACGYILALGLGIWLHQAQVLSLGTVYLLFNYMSMLESPLDQITQQLQEFQKAAAGIRRVAELDGTQTSIVGGESEVAISNDAGLSIEFQNVRFRYAEQEVLKGISFRLEPGEKLGLLGRTGSGKTTLIRLLFRLYDASEGSILLDGVDLRKLTLESLHRSVGMVTQDVHLIHGSVRDNLRFFNAKVSDAEIWDVLDSLDAREFVESLPNGLDTMVAAGGSSLSAGQAQLLAFGRVFLRDPGLVILDEPSSRLDPATERLLTAAIDRLLSKRTGIVIAHRLATVEQADKIMVLSDGRILEYGKRTDLAANPNSRYAQLLRMSSNGENLDEQIDALCDKSDGSNR
jgi:ABC-type multidrug transport system fused ATPase/permease subunit